MEDMIASNVCRLCLWKTAPLIPIFGSNNLYEKVTQLVPISIHPGNGLSQLICGECLYKVELFNEFRSSALKCDKMQQDYRRLWEAHLMSEMDRVPWSSSPDVTSRFRLALSRIKAEPSSCDGSSVTSRPSEQQTNSDKETWPTEVDHEEVMCMTEERPKRRSASLYSRAPCPEPPGCPYICRYCKKELPTSTALVNHEHKHIDNVCLLCDEKLPSEKALRLHVRTVCNKFNTASEEPENEEPDVNIKCSTCLRIFRSSVALWRHCLCLSHNQLQGSDQLEGTRSPQGVEKGLPTQPVGRPPGSVSRGRGISGYSRGRGVRGYSRGRGVSGYTRGRGVSGYSRGRGISGYNRGRGKNVIFNKRRVWVYGKTPCDVCGRIFTSNCGMLIHRKHVHK